MPSASSTLGGTWATSGWSLPSSTVRPPAGAGPSRVTAPTGAGGAPPVTSGGATTTLASAELTLSLSCSGSVPVLFGASGTGTGSASTFVVLPSPNATRRAVPTATHRC